jgi:HEAT repeat protein
MRWLKHSRLKSKEPEVRRNAIEQLTQDCGLKEIKLFAHALRDEHAGVRSAAMNAISILRETSAAPCIAVLLPLLRDKDFELRREAVLALEILCWIPNTSEERVLKAIAQENFNDIAANEEAAIDLLLPLLKNESPAIRLAAAQTFERFHARVQDARMTEPLIVLLNDIEVSVRVAALHALSASSDERRIPPLLKLLKDELPQMRASAVEAIGKSGNAECLPKILPLLKDPKFEVRVATVSALGKMKNPDALEPIISMLTDSDVDMRKTAVESLTKLADPRSVAALIATLIDRESIVRHAAANALQVINFKWQISEEAQKAIPYLEESLKHEEYWVREAASKALARIRNL